MKDCIETGHYAKRSDQFVPLEVIHFRGYEMK